MGVCTCMGGYGGLAPQPCSLALANDTGIASLEDTGVHRNSTGVIKYSVCQDERFQCHRMMQHLQKRCLLPPTDGGGVTGAK